VIAPPRSFEQMMQDRADGTCFIPCTFCGDDLDGHCRAFGHAPRFIAFGQTYRQARAFAKAMDARVPDPEYRR